MNQPNLRILCLIHDEELSYLQVPAEEELAEHEVTVVTDYESAKKLVLDEKRGIPPFDVVLADVSVPGGVYEGKFDTFGFCPVLLQPYLDTQLVRGLGIFVPPHFESAFQSSDGYAAVVASRECFTPLNTRDWRKLLDLVVRATQ